MPEHILSNTYSMQLRKIKMTITSVGKDFHYFRGEIVECPADRAKGLISGGYAVPADETERAIKKDNVQNQDSGSKPANKPSRGKVTSKGKRKHR